MEKLKMIFTRFAEQEARGKSPLYGAWCERIVAHDDLLSLISQIPISQPKPNLFFASVQYLALQGDSWMRQVFEAPGHISYDESFDRLVKFCGQHEEELIHLFHTKLVQTNEVQRANFLYPLFADIAYESGKPLTLIEIGTSAGLLLNVDQYRYELQQEEPLTFGHEESPLTLRAKNFGEPLTLKVPPTIHARFGIDLNVIDLRDALQYAWLQSLIWPEETDRKELLAQAKAVHETCEKQLFTGDFRELLPRILENPPLAESQIVIFHTHVANQFPRELKDDLLHLLNELSTAQPIYHIYNNMFDGHLHVDYIASGVTKEKKVLHNTDSHGRHFHWKN